MWHVPSKRSGPGVITLGNFTGQGDNFSGPASDVCASFSSQRWNTSHEEGACLSFPHAKQNSSLQGGGHQERAQQLGSMLNTAV